MTGELTADAVVLGGGAAGLMCAATAGRMGRDVVVVDHASKLGTKILIAGGGRCNFTNTHAEAGRFLSANAHFAKSALARYTQWDFIDLVERHGIGYHEKKLGQLFCDTSARAILDMLLAECAAGGVRFITGERVNGVEGGEPHRVVTEQHTVTAPNLVIACGAPAVPKTGASGFAYDLARRFGLALETPHGREAPRPGLVPLTLGGEMGEMARALRGVAADSHTHAAGPAFRENILFTHRGISGPAVLQASNTWTEGAPVTVDLLPDLTDADHLVHRKRARPKAALSTVLAEHLPARFAERLAASGPGDTRIGAIADKRLRGLATGLRAWTLYPGGTEGFAKAEVALGGVATGELSQKTMAARRVPGLYVIGEAVDVTGWLGGYNFQWAWSSGWCAGMALAGAA